MSNGISLEKMEVLTEEVRLMTAEYNTAAATVEQTGKLIREKESLLAELGDRIVMGGVCSTAGGVTSFAC